MIQYGTITQYRYTTDRAGKKLEVKVSVDDRVTNWLPVKTQASSFLVVHTPVRINDQVIVFNPFGNNEDGFVDRNLTYKDIPLPDGADEDTYIYVFEDGTTFKHNTKSKIINLTTDCDVFVESTKMITLKSPNIVLDADVAITGNLNVSKEINDVLGTLTNHKHTVKDHAVAVPR